jgi:GNAT superfamily N-acetyltransferase
MTIAPMSEMPHAVKRVARWFYHEWNVFDGRSIAQIEAQLAENLNRDCVPITFVAQADGDLLGTASLDVSDLPPFDHLSPWLASLYVEPSARSAGIGSALVRHVQQFASSHGIQTLYLWTPGSIRLYERCGWIAFERPIYNSQRITLMRFETLPQSPTTSLSLATRSAL